MVITIIYYVVVTLTFVTLVVALVVVIVTGLYTEVFFVILIIHTDFAVHEVIMVAIAEIAIIVVTIITKAPTHKLKYLGCLTPKRG